MIGLENSIMELHGMFKTIEESIVQPRNSISTTFVLAIRYSGVKERGPLILILSEKGKGKLVIKIPILRRTFHI